MMPEQRAIRILMAEDSPSDAELARQAFKNGKLLNELTIVKDGVEALAYLRKEGEYQDVQRPDVILLDLNMPKKDGREVLEEIKKDPNLRTIPVVILTTSEDEHDILRSYELQASSFITKPVEFEKFLDVAKGIRQFYFNIVTLPPNGDR
ncbi:response regulator [Candidatus Obscuribacterales bacterium]|nr:response regulator [Candidatus Obscuribacterales bacterium]MBX3135624.1 response regulator [Candidatus Obscuribacterales bacterium]MBX3149050.1 response regulator [Candidatus Obscuribacterales bacterium]